VDGGQSAGQPSGGTEFLEGQVRLVGQQRPQLVLMAGDNTGLAARAMMLWANVAETAALLEQLLDQAQGDPKLTGDRRASILVSIVSCQNPFPQIQGDGFHPKSLPHPKQYGYGFV
jgi:hypothetical protein